MLGSPDLALGSHPLARLNCPGPTFAVFWLLCLVNKTAVLSPRPFQGPPEQVGLEGPLWGEAQVLSTAGTLETFLSPPGGLGRAACFAFPGFSVCSTNHPFLPPPEAPAQFWGCPRPAWGVPKNPAHRPVLQCDAGRKCPESPEWCLTVLPGGVSAGSLSPSVTPGLGEP